MKISLKTKIIISFVTVIVVLGVIATLAGIHFIGSGIIRQAQGKVRLDLNTAHEVYKNKLESIRTILEFTAIRPSIIKALIEQDRETLKLRLDEVRRGGGIDILAVTDAKGEVVLRSHNPSEYGDSQAGDPIVKGVMEEKIPLCATEIIQAQELEKEGADFVQRARIEIIPTPKAEPRPEGEERDGMILMAAVPILYEEGELAGVIYGGNLLNRNYEIVDKIKDIVYRDEKYGGKDIGTATIFQGDLRISTNVMDSQGERAIGTRVSREVNDRVLKEGGEWIGEAFVVNDWYITAYEPIYNLDKKIIGILYVGILKRPFTDARVKIVAVFLGIVLLGVIVAILVANFLAGRISRPLREMKKTAQQIAAGDYSRDIAVRSGDEVGELADSFNRMTGKLLSVQDELKRWGETLEEKVEERTAKIKEMQKQLVHAEKMASVGKLAAGVAHEINNPLTGILTNSSLLLEEFKEGSREYEDIKAIVDETIRCREIVKGLLDFSRQTEPKKALADINGLIETVVVLVQNQVAFQDIRIKKDLAPSLPRIMVDKDQISQVFMNIVLNAAEAMPRGGELNIQSEAGEGAVLIKFADTGCGIDKEHIGRLFDPFFSTKEKGTGLGLSISYGIVERHGGTIEVESKPGRGSIFVVKLPVPMSK